MPFVSPIPRSQPQRRQPPTRPRQPVEQRAGKQQKRQAPKLVKKLAAKRPKLNWNNDPIYQKRRRGFAIIAGALLIILIIIIGLAVHSGNTKQAEIQEPDITQSAPPTPNPDSLTQEQLASIGSTPILLLNIPGTWETTLDSEPNKDVGLLAPALRAVVEKNHDAISFFNLPYPAEFKNVSKPKDDTYNDSRAHGVARALQVITTYLSNNPKGSIVLTGFSQGAVIAGDVAATIGNNKTSISPYKILGVALVADGRRETRYGMNQGHDTLSAQGLEVTLSQQPALADTLLATTGAIMTGSRQEDFGVLRGRVMQICNPRDMICSAPNQLKPGDIANLDSILGPNSVHAKYRTTKLSSLGNKTVPVWIRGWLTNMIRAGLAQ